MKKLLIKPFYGWALVLMTALASCNDDFTAPPAPEGETIVDVADDDANLDIFSAALVKTGLSVTLDNNNAGAFTVFAPSDDGFLAYLKTTSGNAALTEQEAIDYINSLTSSTSLTVGTLSARLTYLIVSSRIPSSTFANDQVFTTLNFARLSISKPGDVLLNASATVLTMDTEASNGLIHTINKVLTPPSTASALALIGITGVNYGTNPPTISGGSATGGDTVRLNYNILAYALVKTGLVTTLQPNVTPLPDFTIFAPTDDAMRAYLLGTSAPLATAALENSAINVIKNYTADQLAIFKNKLMYHIVPGRVLTSDLSNGEQVTTLLTGTPFGVTIGGSIVLSDLDGDVDTNSTVTSANILTNAGVVQRINRLLEPTP